MLVREQMVIAVFIISIAFGAEPESQLRIGHIRPSADRAFVPRDIDRPAASGKTAERAASLALPVRMLSKRTAPGLPAGKTAKGIAARLSRYLRFRACS